MSEILRGIDAAGSRHVLDHEGGIAREVLAHVPCQQASIGIITAARRVADNHGDLLALVEIVGTGVYR